MLFLKKIILFSAIAAFVLWAYLQFAAVSIEKVKGPDTRTQITQSFENALLIPYNTVIVGSSKAYRGIEPDLLDSAYNFAHDNDIFNQHYYKLQYLLRHKKRIDNIIIGYDYFSFSYISSSRNSIYKNYFDDDYLKDYQLALADLRPGRMDKTFNDFMTITFTNTFKPFITGFFGKDANRPQLTAKGHYKRFGIAADAGALLVHDSANVLAVQLNYFYKLLQLCNINNIRMFLVMLPTTAFENNHYTGAEKQRIDSIAADACTRYTDLHYLKYATDSSFALTDFEDAMHLNVSGAAKFSRRLKDDINKIILKK